MSGSGYIRDEWRRWQQGSCDAYALALLELFPELRFGVLGRSYSDGWMITHFFAHDDVYAYDSAGRHPLPYAGVDNDLDVCCLDQVPGEYGVGYEAYSVPDAVAALVADVADAKAHARRHGVGPRGA